MCRFKFRLLVTLLTFGIGVLGVSFWIFKNTKAVKIKEDLPVPTANTSNAEQAITSKSLSPIRSVDFRNFTYPLTEDLDDPTNPKRTFTLTDGEHPETTDEMNIILSRVEYGDVTNDSQEEAIVTMSIRTGGSATPHIVYVYTLENDHPRLLRSFSTGDRADEGLKDVYPENGQFVVDLYSPIDAQGACCPKFFTRTKYKWTDKSFQKVENQELIPVP